MTGECTIGRWVRDRGRGTPDRVAIRFRGEATTYAELDERSGRLAAALRDAGVGRGDRVASLTGNAPEHVELLFACARTVGWVAHALEEYAEPGLRFRPTGVYTGPRPGSTSEASTTTLSV